MLTLKQVNKAIEEAGFKDIELVKSGEGYFYFWPTCEKRHWLDQLNTKSVYVMRLNQLTLEQWLDELRTFQKIYTRYHSKWGDI